LWARFPCDEEEEEDGRDLGAVFELDRDEEAQHRAQLRRLFDLQPASNTPFMEGKALDILP